MMIVTTPPNRGLRSRKRKRVVEEMSNSAEAVSEKNLNETTPMFRARWRTTAYKSNSMTRKLAEVLTEKEAATVSGADEDFKPQKVKAKRGSQLGNVGGGRWQRMDLESTPER